MHLLEREPCTKVMFLTQFSPGCTWPWTSGVGVSGYGQCRPAGRKTHPPRGGRRTFAHPTHTCWYTCLGVYIGKAEE